MVAVSDSNAHMSRESEQLTNDPKFTLFLLPYPSLHLLIHTFRVLSPISDGDNLCRSKLLSKDAAIYHE